MKWILIYLLCGQEVWSEPSMGARMVPANGQTIKTKKIFYMSFWLERLSILLQIYTFACNFCSRKGGRASIGYRASIGTYTVCQKMNVIYCSLYFKFLIFLICILVKSKHTIWYWKSTIVRKFKWTTVRNVTIIDITVVHYIA